MPQLPRRTLLIGAALAGAASQLPTPRQANAQTAAQNLAQAAAGDSAVPLHCPENGAPQAPVGTTWGVPWPRGAVAPAEQDLLCKGSGVAPRTPLRVTETGGMIEVDTGAIRCRIARHGDVLVHSIVRGERTVATRDTPVARAACPFRPSRSAARPCSDPSTRRASCPPTPVPSTA